MSEIDFNALAAPFAVEDIEWRIGRSGKTNNTLWATCLCYMTSRAVMDRLDDVVGPENWQTRLEEHGGHVRFGLGIRIGGEWVWKWDGADITSGAGDENAMKGGASNGLKRAAVQWGMGRYLYKLPEAFAEVSENKRALPNRGSYKDGDKRVYFSWSPPALPAWAVPAGTATEAPSNAAGNPPTRGDEGGVPDPRCPVCEGSMWDNREKKTNPKSPDYKCKDKECDHPIWLNALRRDAEPIVKRLLAVNPGDGNVVKAQEVLRVGDLQPSLAALEWLREQDALNQDQPAGAAA